MEYSYFWVFFKTDWSSIYLWYNLPTYMPQTFLLVLGDTIAFVGALFVMLTLDFHKAPSAELFGKYLHAFTLPFFATLLFFYILDLYEKRRSIPTPRSIGRFIFGILISGIVIALYFYAFPRYGISPKTNLAIFVGTFFLLSVLIRRLYFSLFSRSLARSIVFVGETPEVAHLRDELLLHPHLGTTIATFPTFADYLATKPSADLLVLARDEGVRELRDASHIETPIETIQSAYEEMFGKTPLSLLSNEEVFGILEKKTNGGIRFLYRTVEIVFASLVLIVFSPFLLLSMLAIYLEDGAPVFYTQSRVGLRGELFSIWKLRTMTKNAEASGAKWADKRDTRITRIGAFLRKSHLDEVPQMWNIIRGDIALVGPRPERPEFVAMLEQEIPYYFVRHTVKPGFTGWAQVKYRYARTVDDSKEKFEYDLYYLRARSPFLDLGIVAKTIQIIFTH